MKSIRQKAFPYFMILPTILIFGIFLFIPALNGLWISLTEWDGLNPQVFVGLQNYVELLKDKSFWEAFLSTMFFTAVTVPLIYAAALALALMLTSKIKASSWFRAAFYWPTMISSIIVGLSWKFLLGDMGIVNYLLTKFGMEPINWLTNANYAMSIVIFVSVWSMAGYYMVMFVAGLNSISETYYEAAAIDGATYWQKFWFITLPLLKPTSLLVLVLSLVSVIKTYPLVYALTMGGPAGATTFMVQMIQETGFRRGEMGYACAMTTILFIILALLTVVQFKLNKGGEQDAG